MAQSDRAQEANELEEIRVLFEGVPIAEAQGISSPILATIEPSGGSEETTHQYDAFSRRVHREFGNTDEVLLWWGKEEYAEHENIGSQPTIQNDLHAHPTGLNTTFSRALEGSKHDIQYFHKNYLDHVCAVSDDRGDIVEHYRYTAFGEPEFYNESGEQLVGSAIDNDILWNVKRYSEASGLYMYLYRHYEAEHGRWPSRDPIAEQGGVNVYVFLINDTLNLIDVYGNGPLGRAIGNVLGGFSGAVGGAYTGAALFGGGGALVAPGAGTIAGGAGGYIGGGVVGGVGGWVIGVSDIFKTV